MIKPIAIYLPQFHPIPENDAAWGEGFTEWTNVKKAKPLFEGHDQPHIPHEDVGYYDLRDPEVLVKQAAMAKEYGIYGFAFYHYWFNGKRLLNLPLDNMLKLGKPDFPFCYIWANEPWSKRWDGSNNEVIQTQTHSFEDDVNHIRFLCENVFSDKRYIKIDGKPMFIVYRTELFPNISKTAKIWRREVKKYGFKDIFLVRVEHFVAGVNPLTINFDAGMEFAPDTRKWGIGRSKFNESELEYTDYNYIECVANMVIKKYDYVAFRCVFPSWDNSSRRKKNVVIFSNAQTDIFLYFVFKIFKYTKNNLPKEKQYVFINAWNEWAEGCHIEPDKKNGYKYLEIIKSVLNNKKICIPINYCNFIENDRGTILLNTANFEKVNNSLEYKIGRLMLYPIKKTMYYIKRILKIIMK